MAVRFTFNSSVELPVDDAYFLSESKLLVNLTDNMWYKEAIINVDLPCDTEFLSLICQYFRYGCLPKPITSFRMYESLNQSFDYLLCDTASMLITLDDEKLNVFSDVDTSINSDKEDITISLFDEKGKWVTQDKLQSEYGLVLKPVRHVLSRRPEDIFQAIDRIFTCNGRRGFIKKVFLLFKGYICIAGGCMQYMFQEKISACVSDIDFFLLNMNADKLDMFVKAFSCLYEEFFGKYMVLRTKYTVTFFRLVSRHRNTVQIVLRNYASVCHVLKSFDLDSSCIAYDGNSIVTNRRGLRCIQTGCNLVDVKRQSTTFEKRLLKYHRKYDIGVVAPNFDVRRLDFSRATFGLSKLLDKKPSFTNVGYDVYGSISSSRSLRELRLKVGENLTYTLDKVPFILRYNNPLLFEYFGDEERYIKDDFKNPSFVGDIGSFDRVKGPWHAQAYGGDMIPEIMTVIDTAVNVNDIHPKRSWKVELGPSVIGYIEKDLEEKKE